MQLRNCDMYNSAHMNVMKSDMIFCFFVFIFLIFNFFKNYIIIINFLFL